MSKVHEIFGCHEGATQFGLQNATEMIVGVECEIEAVKSHGKCMDYAFDPDKT
jgi:hypothetical protein